MKHVFDLTLRARLTLRYTLALGFVAALTLASYGLMENAVGTEVMGARLLNVAGRQRMLCQRVEILALRALRASGQDREDRLGELDGTVRELAQGHDELVHGPPEALGLAAGNPALAVLREDVQGGEERMHRFLDESGGLRAALARGDGEAELLAGRLSRLGDALLVHLDDRMTELQRLGESTLDRLRGLILVLLATALAALLGTGLFVLRPMVAEVVRDREHMEALNRTLETQAGTDKLTGVFNRRSWDAEIGREFAKTRRQNAELCMIMTDLDHFKRVNDTHGHQRGDVVLREFTKRLRQVVRDSDTVYRLGGEEFAVLLPGTDIEKGSAVAEKLREQVAARPLAGLPVTASFGVAATTGAESPDELFRRADQALYAAKANGRNRVEKLARSG